MSHVSGMSMSNVLGCECEQAIVWGLLLSGTVYNMRSPPI